MGNAPRRLIILGPQPEYQSLSIAVGRLEVDPPVALITAGWEVEEGDDLAVRNAIPNTVLNLELFKRTEQLFADDPELIGLLRDRQDDLRFLRDAYRVRLDHGLEAARHLLKLNSNVEYDLEPEVESAIEQIRQLDRQYFVRTCQICDACEKALDTPNRKHVDQHRAELRNILDQCGAIVISGGHTAIILNRLRIFGILDLTPSLPIIAWSGGAMALAEQIVFFHDSPPQGAGNPEVLRSGMGILPDLLPLPDAQHRLDLKDANRVELFARRFNRYRCAELNEHTILDYQNGAWADFSHSKQLSIDGTLLELAG